ncbi:colicin uptake protein TolQ [Symmachiella dynata]|uniref:MotA/TolQ/ExbB proton channel family protein n=1 Tax=Symmachiella dynata TaxID=2527995 RepID=UPI00118AAE29|nr:MotA/TolQ/ExbB proton channel family protein [Symmachiella dynata]QDT49442.1 colicin uptake protein TolQ [Symmachiella dynata]
MSWKYIAPLRLPRGHFVAIIGGCWLLAIIPAVTFAQGSGEPATEPAPATAPAQAPGDDAANEASTPDAAARPATLFEKLTAGNMTWFMLPIVIASIIATWFSIERLMVLRRRTVIPYAFVTRFLEHLEQDRLDPQLAVKLCEENGSPIAQVFAHGVRKWGKPSVEIEQAIIDGGERQVSNLRRHLRVLNGVATVAPLLGLLGTVVGMIMAFDQIAGGTAMGKAEQLAGGIGVALLTTAGGLTVAIPSLILYMYLSGRVDILVMEMDALAQKVVGLISAESIAERRENDRPSRKKAKDKVTAESA